MSLAEWYWLFDVKRTDKPASGMSDDELEELYQLLTPKGRDD